MNNRIVKLPSVESFGRLTPDKWLCTLGYGGSMSSEVPNQSEDVK